MTVNVGVIGVGMIGQDHIRRLTTVLAGARVSAVTELSSPGSNTSIRPAPKRCPGLPMNPTTDCATYPLGLSFGCPSSDHDSTSSNSCDELGAPSLNSSPRCGGDDSTNLRTESLT